MIYPIIYPILILIICPALYGAINGFYTSYCQQNEELSFVKKIYFIINYTIRSAIWNAILFPVYILLKGLELFIEKNQHRRERERYMAEEII